MDGGMNRYLAGLFSPKSEVGRGDPMQYAGRECHSSGFSVLKNTPQPSLRHPGSASCAISFPPTSEFGLNLISRPSEEPVLLMPAGHFPVKRNRQGPPCSKSQ